MFLYLILKWNGTFFLGEPKKAFMEDWKIFVVALGTSPYLNSFVTCEKRVGLSCVSSSPV